MKNAAINRKAIKAIAKALGELNDEVIYVGGATVGLYINDPAADDLRPTKDLDISVSLASLSKLENLRLLLVKRGFRQTAEDNVICRFRYDDIKVDVMNTTPIGWAPANSWFAPGFKQSEKVIIDDQVIRILPLHYFLASKFEAYNARGNNEPRTSHDFEDIVYIIDNRTDFVEQILSAPPEVNDFLEKEFQKIIFDTAKQEAIFGNLYHEIREERFQIIMNKLNSILR